MLKPWRAFCLFSAAWLLSPAVLAGMPAPMDGSRLGVQTCDTQCQSTETDCDLACDQVAPCVEECRKVSESCTQKCHDSPPPDSKPETPAKPSAPARKAPAKGAPAKGAAPKAPAKPKPA